MSYFCTSLRLSWPRFLLKNYTHISSWCCFPQTLFLQNPRTFSLLKSYWSWRCIYAILEHSFAITPGHPSSYFQGFVTSEIISLACSTWLVEWSYQFSFLLYQHCSHFLPFSFICLAGSYYSLDGFIRFSASDKMTVLILHHKLFFLQKSTTTGSHIPTPSSMTLAIYLACKDNQLHL